MIPKTCQLVSLRSYAFSNVIESHTTYHVHSLALSYNHNVWKYDEQALFQECRKLLITDDQQL